MQLYVEHASVSSKTICVLSPWVYNRVEEEDITVDNDSAITAIKVSSKTTCILFTFDV